MQGFNHVEPGGAPLLVPLSGSVTMIKVSVGPVDNNAYVLQSHSGDTLLIDAANDDDRLLKIIADQSLDTIVTTHRHDDHWQALASVAAATGARLICGQPDLEAISTGASVQGMIGVWDGDHVELGAERVEVIGLVGHTPGSITVSYEGGAGVTHLFTGDSLFPGGPGKTNSA
jgi:glyoxylase-like metal-dependent hydrolase (beta-lactamase superfamily II)